MDDKRQQIQLRLAFMEEGKGEALGVCREGTEASVAVRAPESPAICEYLMEEVLERDNLRKALRRVKSNKGSPGIDGMSVWQLPGYLQEHWQEVHDQLLGGTYKPQAVKRVEIAKPDWHPQAQGKRGEERGGPAMGVHVSGIQFYFRSRDEEANSASGH